MLAMTAVFRTSTRAPQKFSARLLRNLSSAPDFSAYVPTTTHVNAQYIPDVRPNVAPPVHDNSISGSVSSDHWEDSWSDEKLDAARSNLLATWGPSAPLANTMIFDRGEGVYIYDSKGNKYLDWTSQAVCANLGHDVPPAIKEAINQQLDKLPMAYGGMGIVEVRLRLCQLLSELCPGDMNSFLFPSGGGEANEAAIRIARRFTGKHKIMNQYRSYHGGQSNSLTATGDFRRWFAESGTSGFVKMFNPQPFGFTFADNDDDKTGLLLSMLEEQILMEGPNTVAAIMLEPIVGAGGALVSPKGYLEGVRSLCDKYEILLILDEVMVGFGRTGKFWGFQHFEGVVPDILTSAKGLSASIVPLAMLGVRDHIKEFFMTTPLGWGATYANHPVALACAYESVKHVVKHDLPGRAAALEPVMVEEMQKLVNNHSCVRQGRAIGLFGCIDLTDSTGNMVQKYEDPRPAVVVELQKAMLANGLLGLFRPPLLHCAPPLIITENELRDGFDRLDKSLTVADY